MRHFWIALASAIAAGSPAIAEQLSRPVALGVTGIADQTHKGVRIQTLLDDHGGKSLGLRVDDVLLAVDGQPTPDMPTLAGIIAAKSAGAPIRLEIDRGGARRALTGKAPERPRERFANGVADYGAVAFKGGLLRDIMATPAGGAKGPVLFLVQGYTCDPVETASPESAHRQLIDGLLARGISTYRVEKPQAGDSRGGPSCLASDFETEMAAFRAGYDALVTKRGIAPERIFILGHSMGGIEAPLLAQYRAPAGVAVYGTAVRNWQDYMLDVLRLQGFVGASEDPVVGEGRSETMRSILHDFFNTRQTPAQIAAAAPENGKLLREYLAWDGGTQIYDRHYSFWQGLAAQRLVSTWRDVKSNVLSIYGESDVEAISCADQRMIVDIVNHYRPGSARFIEIARTGHGMRIDGSPQEVRRARAAGTWPPADRRFNPAIVETIGDWIDATYVRR